MMRILEIHSYAPEWVRMYEQEEEMLRSLLGEAVVGIHHIGSTSVVGLAAKPIFDILLEVPSLRDIDQKSERLVAYGYEAKGEFGIAGRRFFVKGRPNPTHHVHAFASGDANIFRHLAFRNHLRRNPEIAKEYEAVKRQALESCGNDIDKYCAYKNGFIKEAEAAALALKCDGGWERGRAGRETPSEEHAR